MQFAWKALLYKAFHFLKQHTTESSTHSTSPSVLELRRQLQTSGDVSEEKTTTTLDSWANRYVCYCKSYHQLGSTTIIEVAQKKSTCIKFMYMSNSQGKDI